MPDNFTLGKDCKLYRSAALLSATVTPDNATWLEADIVRDLANDLTTGEADITTRGNNGFKASAATLKAGGIDFEVLWRPGDAQFDALLAAWTGSTEIAMMALDGSKDVVGKQGLAGNFVVTNFTRPENLDDAVKSSVSIRPSSFTEWQTTS
jgi:hypothetical protein